MEPKTYIVRGQTVVVQPKNGTQAQIKTLAWGPGAPDVALTIICDALGEKPKPKKIEKSRGARLVAAFRRAFPGLEYTPGKQIKSTEIAAWLAKQGVAA